MSKKSDLALVPRLPSAIEKAGAGPKRILAGMVADTLALMPARSNAEAEGWLEKGNSYYESEDYAEAVKWYRKAAEQGLAVAQNDLGVCYENGEGVPQDYAEAVKWYRKAAEQGNVEAQSNLGNCYQLGNGVTQDFAEAAKWHRKAAEQGNVEAQLFLGNYYSLGLNVRQDLSEAAKWYRKSCRARIFKGPTLPRCLL